MLLSPARNLLHRTASPLARMTSSSSLAPRTSPCQTLAHLKAAVQHLTPLALAEKSWDNVGLLVEAPFPRRIEGVRKVFTCIDLTNKVAEEALSDPSTAVILTYHPPIFSGLKSITLGVPLQRSLLSCIASGVSIFCLHTAADNALGGTNDLLGSALLKAAGLDADVTVGERMKAIKLSKEEVEGHEGGGSGRIVDLGEGLSRDAVVKAVKELLGVEHLQAAWSSVGPSTIKTVAICAGSGESVLSGVQADLYLTGEMSHHYLLAAQAKGIHSLICNHSATERPWLKFFGPRLEGKLNEVAGAQEGGGRYEVVVSKEDREPLVVV